ncbi:MAG: T9SS type A sorting domain-containing protein [Candidatus Zixiibacteriota bacterium]
MFEKIILILLIIITVFSQDISCPDGFIPIPADPEMGTYADFCVSKYEMKIVGLDDGNIAYDSSYVAESRASGTPWRNMNQVQAKAECEALGDGFALISNAEWMTIAHNIERVAANWSDNSSHETGITIAKLNIGHTCRKGPMGADCRIDGIAYSGEALPASEDDSDGLYGYVIGDWGEDSLPTLNENGWNLYRRTFYLTNGEIIWDFAGNLWEWTDYYIARAEDRARVDGVIDNEYLEINAAEPMSDLMVETDYKSINTLMREPLNRNCLGRYHPTAIDDSAGCSMRGGNFMHGMYNNGIYAIGMGYSPDAGHLICRIGFRCVYHPDEAAIEDAQVDIKSEIICHPNPFNGRIHIEIPDDIHDFAIYDVSGKLIYRPPENSFTWQPKQKIPAGSYILRYNHNGQEFQQVLSYVK